MVYINGRSEILSMYFSTWENHVYANFLETIVPVSLDRHGNTSIEKKTLQN